MLLYDADADASSAQAILPDYFYIQSSSMQVTNSFATINGNYGQVLTSKKGNIAPRLFTVTGNVEADTIEQVEQLRSSLFSKMFGKTLYLFVNDNDVRKHKVVLDGAVNVSYNLGNEIARVFTFNFTLKSFQGVCWAKESEEMEVFVDINEKPATFEFSLDYKGDVPIMPFINMNMMHLMQKGGFKSTKIAFTIEKSQGEGNKPLLQCGGRTLRFFEDVNVASDFSISEGLPYSDGKIISSIDKNCLASPFLLQKGKNTFSLNPKAIKPALAGIETEGATDIKHRLFIKVSFLPCFF